MVGKTNRVRQAARRPLVIGGRLGCIAAKPKRFMDCVVA